MNNRQNKNSYGARGIITIAVILLIAIAVNLLFSLIPDKVKKIDLSTEQLTKVSDEAKDYLKRSLDSSIKMYLVAEAGMEDISITEFLGRLNSVDSRISFETVDPTVRRTFLENLTGASPDELADNTVIVQGEKFGSVKIIAPENLYNYEVFIIDADTEEYVSYGEYSFREFTSVYTSLSEYFNSGYAYYEQKFNGETSLVSAIDYVLTDPEKLPKVYFTSLHGETAISDSLAELLELSNLPAQQITLTEGIPSDAGIVVMNVPVKDVTEEEAEKLEAYLKNDGKLFLITSHTKVSSLENLHNVLEKYGLSAEDHELYESNSAYHQSGYPNNLLPDTSVLELLYGIDNFYFLASSPHAINMNTELESITYTTLLQTTTGAYYEIESEEDEDTDNEGNSSTQSDAAQFSIAVSALSNDGGEIVWFATPYMLTDDDNTLTGGGNYIHFTAMLSSLCDKNTVIFASKTIEQDILTLSAGQAGFWAVILIAAIPGAVITFGAVKIRRRKKA